MKKLERGAATFTVCEILHDGTGGKIETRIEKARAHCAKDPRAEGSFGASGFTSGVAALESDITATNSVIDGVLKLHYRTIQRKVVPSMLRATIEQMEAEARALNDGHLKRKERKQIKIDAKQMLEKNAPYTLREIEIVFYKHEILIGSTSKHDVEIVRNALSHGLEILTKEICPTPAADFTRQDFFTWLMNSEPKKLKTGVKIETSFAGAVEFFSRPACEGDSDFCTKATIDGPCVNESEEIRTVLRNKKTISRAKIHLSDGNLAWTFKFDADHWKFGGVKIIGNHGDGLGVRAMLLLQLNDILTDLFYSWNKQREEDAGIQELPGLDAEKDVEFVKTVTDVAKKAGNTIANAIDAAVKKAAEEKPERKKGPKK